MAGVVAATKGSLNARTESKSAFDAAKELRRLHDELIDAQAQRNAAFHSIEHQRDLLGKANALNRIRYERVKLLTGQRDELLDALRKIEQRTVDGGRIHKLARAAIAKATGEKQ